MGGVGCEIAVGAMEGDKSGDSLYGYAESVKFVRCNSANDRMAGAGADADADADTINVSQSFEGWGMAVVIPVPRDWGPRLLTRDETVLRDMEGKACLFPHLF
jgi:hypothetical protein